MSSSPQAENPQDPASEFVSLMLEAQRGLRNYLLSLHPVPGDTDDLMQQTALTLWREFERYDRSRPFLPWALKIAYFEVLRLRTTRSRDLLVFTDHVLELLAEEEDPPQSMLQAKRLALGVCLAKLSNADREILMSCYGHGTTIAELAMRRRQKPYQLYYRLDCIRRSLVECVHRQLRMNGDLEPL